MKNHDILTIGDTARRGIEPKWYSGNEYAAHLMADDQRSMCGYTINGAREVPAWHKRCGNCKAKLRKLLDAALEPSPAFVRETVLVTVTRPVKENLEPLVDALQRKVRSNTTWDCEFVFQKTEIVPPELEPVGHANNCGALFGEQCDCGAEDES